MYSVSQKNPPPPRLSEFFHFVTNGYEFLIDFFTHLLYVPMYAILQIFIQLSPTLTKLCHIKRDYSVPSSHNNAQNVQNAPKRARQTFA